MLANDTHFLPEDVSGSGRRGWEPGEWHRPLQGHLYCDGPAPGVPGRLDLQTEPGRFPEEATIAWDLERKRMQAVGGGLFLERQGAMGTWGRGLDPGGGSSSLLVAAHAAWPWEPSGTDSWPLKGLLQACSL